jgi:8-oxo-dGTP pyrophosphatase MutT (NUDIX family)
MTWKRLDSRVVFDNDWFTVKEDRVVSPTGSEHDYGHIHFKNTAVAIVPIDDAGNTWLVGQDRYTLGEYSWEVPMGGSHPGEDPAETAVRELREETGLTAGRLELVMKVHTSNSITDEVGLVYVAEQLESGAPQFDEMEDLQMRKLPLGDAVEMVMRGEITDAISVAALLRIAAQKSIRADTT